MSDRIIDTGPKPAAVSQAQLEAGLGAKGSRQQPYLTLEAFDALREEIARLEANEQAMNDAAQADKREIERLKNDTGDMHCKDCCCARSWDALGDDGPDHGGIVSAIMDLRKERDDLKATAREEQAKGMEKLQAWLTDDTNDDRDDAIRRACVAEDVASEVEATAREEQAKGMEIVVEAGYVPERTKCHKFISAHRAGEDA